MANKNLLDKLQVRWNLKSINQVLIVLLVFACTGFTIYFLKKPIVGIFNPEQDNHLFTFLYYLLIFPVYNIILLIYGFLFGQFRFFWEFEKRMFNRLRRSKAE